MAKDETLKLPVSPRAALETFILQLESSYYQWYKGAVAKIRGLVFTLHRGAILTSLSASFLTVVFTEKDVKAPTILLPTIIVFHSMGALLACVIIQGVDRYKSRVKGQVATQSLGNERTRNLRVCGRIRLRISANALIK